MFSMGGGGKGQRIAGVPKLILHTQPFKSRKKMLYVKTDFKLVPNTMDNGGK
jgi:hypothetical protein